MKNRFGFTLVEVMVVVAIIGALASVATISFNESTAQARDAQRQADLRLVQAAVEQYKQKYGVYPAACGTLKPFSGEPNGEYDCGTAEYIVDLAPEFIPVLPTDPKIDPGEGGYVYVTDETQSVFKMMALDTVESEDVDYSHPFARCGNMDLGIQNECTSFMTEPGNSDLGYTYNNSFSFGAPSVCTDSSQYRNDYAVWGGYAPGGTDTGGTYRDHERAREYFSDEIRCK